MNPLRRALLASALGGTAALLLGNALHAQETNGKSAAHPKDELAKIKPRIIKIHASKFEFSPNHIAIRQGEKVVFELTSIDFIHGFSIPDLNTRIDIQPGQVTLLPLTAEKAGDFIFLCDNFCGDGHEKMQGKLTVVPWS